MLPADNLTGSYTTVATPTSQSGNYAITASVIDPNGKLGNYTLTTNNGTLTITALPLVLAVQAVYTNQGPVDLDNPPQPAWTMLSATGEANRMYSVMASTNLLSWTILTNVTADTNGIFNYVDPKCRIIPGGSSV